MTHADCAWILLPLGAQRNWPPSLLRAPLQPPLGARARGLQNAAPRGWDGKPYAPTAVQVGQASAETSCSALRVSSRLIASAPPLPGAGREWASSGVLSTPLMIPGSAGLCITPLTPLSPPVPLFPRTEE